MISRRSSASIPWPLGGDVLGAAMRMARLWRDQGKRDEARDLLAPVYGWFTEGFDTLDLKEAKGGYAVAVASERSAADADAVFEVCRPNSPTNLAGANRSCAALILVLRGSITAPQLAPSCQ